MTQECCAAGLRTVAGELSKSYYGSMIARAMSETALTAISEDPNVGVRELTDTLTDSDHFLTDGSHRPYIWGKMGRYEGELADRKLPDTDLPTKRVALAVAVCATRNCAYFEKCTSHLKMEHRK